MPFPFLPQGQYTGMLLTFHRLSVSDQNEQIGGYAAPRLSH